MFNNFGDLDAARAFLAKALEGFLKKGLFSPEQLRAHRLNIGDDLNHTPENMAAFDWMKQFGERLEKTHSKEMARKVIDDAISLACAPVEAKQPVVDKASIHTAHIGGQAMFGGTVSRCQFAVGHGGFHAGRIKVLQSRRGLTTSSIHSGDKNANNILDLSYVYDCGSENLEAFTASLQAYRRDYVDQLEILFVSHLHADHINGIDRLLGYKAPRIVILPYLDLEDIAAIALHDFDGGHFSGSYRDYIRDPVAWWRSRGVGTVVFIEPDGGGEGIATAGTRPDQPISGEAISPTEWDYEKPSAQLSAVLRKPRGPTPAELEAADPGKTELAPQSAVLAGAGSFFRLEWKHDPKDAWRAADWCLVPYVHPVEDAQRAAFRTALLVHLGLQAPEPNVFRKRLVEELASPKQAKALIEIYGDHFASNHNAVSMSLYSGPAYSGPQIKREPYQLWRTEWESISERESFGMLRHEWTQSGWLGTGDSMLKEKKRRAPWLQFYKSFQGNVGILTLPHHGSIHNFHEDILAWNGLHLCLATTVESEARVAGIGETLSQVRTQDRLGLVVDDKPINSIETETLRLFGV